ncbi:unnamed protein product [Brassicogethes aeneus]|uniref:Uncharacterized protein n=1 Tax=Brassicogethes aeneus TaxID=1431903 RepID=A0A9P0AS30_BRAAE|nr:unnamed protein product [Brassicogethes aeneus]
MRDAMEYMRRNASTIGNISGTESMSAIFRNYTAGNLNGRCAPKLITCSSFSQLDSSTWNIDMQELEYNPSKKDLTDAKIHHLLAEELVKPYRRVSIVFFYIDYISEVLNENGDTEPKSSREEWDSPITFTAKSSRVEMTRVTTPTATETMLPWKRDEEEGSAIQQSEFPAWASNKEYLAYNSPSATFLGGLENPRSSVIGLFRRESIGSEPISSTDSTPQRERRGSVGRNTVILIEDGADSDPLGVLQKQPTTSSIPTLPQPPQTPGQRRQVRRGSMLELSGSITRDTIPEETYSTSSLRRPSWLTQSRQRRPSFSRQQTVGLIGNVSSPSLSDSSESSVDEDVECLMKVGF